MQRVLKIGASRVSNDNLAMRLKRQNQGLKDFGSYRVASEKMW